MWKASKMEILLPIIRWPILNAVRKKKDTGLIKQIQLIGNRKKKQPIDNHFIK